MSTRVYDPSELFEKTLTANQRAVLKSVRKNGWESMDDVVRITGLKRSQARSAARSLVKKDMVTVTGRGRFVNITTHGCRIVDDAR